jgi:Ca2+/Na+ antiporter
MRVGLPIVVFVLVFVFVRVRVVGAELVVPFLRDVARRLGRGAQRIRCRT